MLTYFLDALIGLTAHTVKQHNDEKRLDQRIIWPCCDLEHDFNNYPGNFQLVNGIFGENTKNNNLFFLSNLSRIRECLYRYFINIPFIMVAVAISRSFGSTVLDDQSLSAVV